MPDIEIFARLLLCLALGAILGLETETRGLSKEYPLVADKERLGGLRTYMVLSLFGGLSGIMFAQGYEVFAYLMFIAIATVVFAAYILHVQYRHAFGLTTELAILTTVIISFATTSGIISVQILLVIALVLALILSQKRGVGALIRRIEHQELEDIVKFLIVAFVIWPFLPDVTYYLKDLTFLEPLYSALAMPAAMVERLAIVNPFRLWQYVLLISGINLLGYFAAKALGTKRGQVLAAFFGGLVSSTATTVALAHKARKDSTHDEHLAGFALIANAASFITLSLVAFSVNWDYFKALLPLAAGLLFSSLFAGYLVLRFTKANEQGDMMMVKYEPFSLGPALQFVLLLTLVRIGVQMVQFSFGDNAFVAATALSGAVGADVATISIGEVTAVGGIGLELAVFAFLLINLVNYIAKVIYGYTQGNKAYARTLLAGLSFSALIAVLVVLL